MVLRIKELREERGMTQRQLADNTGVSQNTVSCWETEVALPRVRQLPLLANVLSVPIGELFALDSQTSDLCNSTS